MIDLPLLRRLSRWIWLLVLPSLACGLLSQPQPTPTPTKTPRPLVTVAQQLPTATNTAAILPTPMPVEAVPTDTPLPPTDTPVPPPAETPTPEPLPTDTPPPPPPPTNTPAPPPPAVPTNTPVPPPAEPAPTNPPAPAPAASSDPVVIIELPDGDTYSLNDDVRIIITVRDPDGIKEFEWGIFAQNGSPTGLGDEVGCGNQIECRVEDKFETKLSGQFFIGVDAVDSQGNDIREIVQLYVG